MRGSVALSGSIEYTVLIRTFNSEKTLASTLASLARQSIPPSKYVLVDSGSTDGTLTLAPPKAVIHRYSLDKFNYAQSLNEGLPYIDTEYTMIVSSHTSLANDRAVEFAIATLRENEDIAAAYFVQELAEGCEFERIGPRNFTGFNGVWNTCGFYKSSFLKLRQFRPEVFSAEDQDWSNWLLQAQGKTIARISGGGMCYNNPATNRIRKALNERLAVAIYVKPQMLNFLYIARVLYRAIRPVSTMDERKINFLLFHNLLRHKFGGPGSRSRAGHFKSSRSA